MSELLLNIKDLQVDYKTDLETVHAVNGISISLDKGETLGLVGETGAGKTTTALSILGLLPERTTRINHGSIWFDGEHILTVRDKDGKEVPPEEIQETDMPTYLNSKQMLGIRGEKISMIFQDPMTALNPVLTVGDQILEALEMHNEGHTHAELESRVEEVLEMVGIMPSRKKDYPHQFSGGMKQRVVIAIALACDPMLLIADEPTTALDVTIQAQVLAMMMELKEKLNTSMIMITHDLGIVAMTCDKVGVMYAGEIIEYGTLEQVFTGEKHHPYTVGLFNSIPNLEADEKRLHPIDGMMPDPTNLPQGCYFSPRCPHATEHCRQCHPDNYDVDGLMLKCFLFSGKEEN